jgi:hypothetical protein
MRPYLFLRDAWDDDAVIQSRHNHIAIGANRGDAEAFMRHITKREELLKAAIGLLYDARIGEFGPAEFREKAGEVIKAKRNHDLAVDDAILNNGGEPADRNEL